MIEVSAPSFCTVEKSSTLVPQPCLASTYPSRASNSSARRTVVRLMPNLLSIICSGGSGSPGLYSPLRISCFKMLYAVLYLGFSTCYPRPLPQDSGNLSISKHHITSSHVSQYIVACRYATYLFRGKLDCFCKRCLI